MSPLHQSHILTSSWVTVSYRCLRSTAIEIWRHRSVESKNVKESYLRFQKTIELAVGGEDGVKGKVMLERIETGRKVTRDDKGLGKGNGHADVWLAVGERDGDTHVFWLDWWRQLKQGRKWRCLWPLWIWEGGETPRCLNSASDNTVAVMFSKSWRTENEESPREVGKPGERIQNYVESCLKEKSDQTSTQVYPLDLTFWKFQWAS